ncbi:sialin-like isoform X2 [Tigriopus californicus]|nr:sialin-like isoform X2 [Tigriopus californicus]
MASRSNDEEARALRGSGNESTYGVGVNGGGEETKDYIGPANTLRWYQRPVERRYVVASLAFFGFCVIYMLRVNLSVAIVAMTANRSHTMDDGKIIVYPDFTWNLARKVTSWVHFSMDTSTQIPGGWLATKYGGKMVFLTGITATAFLTLLTPALTKAGTGFLIALRILEGLFEGMTYPSIHAIWPNGRHHLKGVVWQGGIFWVLCRDRDCLALIRNASRVHQLGVHFLRLWSNWFGVVLCVWWVVRDSPDEDRKITDHELEYLRTAIGVSSQESMMSPPWKKMMTSRAVWAIIIAHFAENWGFYTLLTGLPMFMRDVLGYKLDAAGFLAAFPYLLMAVMSRALDSWPTMHERKED